MGIASDLVSALDPATFARGQGFMPDPWQERMLRSQSRRLLLNCCRQSGKSTTAALLATHTALFVPDKSDPGDFARPAAIERALSQGIRSYRPAGDEAGARGR